MLVPMDSNNTWYRWSIDCGCGANDHRLCVEHETDYNVTTINFVIGGKTLKQRIRAAWNVLHGEFEYHDIILTDGTLEQLSAAIDNVKRLREER